MKQKKGRLFAEIIIGLILFALTVYEYGYRNVVDSISELREERFIKTRALDKYAALVGQKGDLEEELNSLKEELKNEEAKLLEWQGPSIAAASLQNTIKEIVKNNGGNITTERVNKGEDKGKLKTVSVGMDIVLPDASSLPSIIYSIETSLPYIKISTLDLRVNDLKSPREMTVRLDVSALMKGK